MHRPRLDRPTTAERLRRLGLFDALKLDLVRISRRQRIEL
jgi:hypothetical protein